ncbi:MAG: hypothetical protein ACI8QF_003055, partial [Limisphaerales bacterium]
GKSNEWQLIKPQVTKHERSHDLGDPGQEFRLRGTLREEERGWSVGHKRAPRENKAPPNANGALPPTEIVNGLDQSSARNPALLAQVEEIPFMR